MTESERGGFARLLEGLPTEDAQRAAKILARCPAFDIEAGEPYFRSSLPEAALLLVDAGFGVLRLTGNDASRSIITCEAGAGRILPPPTDHEALFGLVTSRVIAIPDAALGELLLIPDVPRTLLRLLATTLAQKREAIGTFGNTRHLERVRRQLLHLARSYGRVGPDGIRIAFPVSHAVLAEMIGSSRETVTRALDELQRTGFVARRGHTYRLLVSPAALFDAPTA